MRNSSSCLTEKSVPLDKIMEMGESTLRGVLTMRHKQGFDLFDNYEAKDPEINQNAPGYPGSDRFDRCSEISAS